jgi:hypothetical protein
MSLRRQQLCIPAPAQGLRAISHCPPLLHIAHGCGQTIYVGRELAAKLGISVALSRGRESVFEAGKKEADRGVSLLSREAFQPDANGADVLDQSTVRLRA